MKSYGARSSGDVVRRLLGTLWEMLRDALAVGTKWLGETFVRAFVGAMDRLFGLFVRWFVGSFVCPLVRSFDGSFVRASKELYKKTSSGVSAA